MTNIKQEKYPTFFVITYYALMGGGCGGFVLGIFGALMSISKLKLLALIIPFFIGACGVFVGFIPALLTGIIIAKLKIRENGFNVAIIGYLVSSLFGLFFSKEFDVFMSSFGLTGAISAYLVGLIALPKSTNKSTEKSTD